MRLLGRFVLVLLFIITISNCDHFFLQKKEFHQSLDTIVDFSAVDVSPTFKECDSLIDKLAQKKCFRKMIHQKVIENLSKHTFKVSESINENVAAIILINQKGEFKLQQLKSSKNIEKQIPKFDSLLKVSIKNIPKVYPAIKRSIPVATQYELPIRIVMEDN